MLPCVGLVAMSAQDRPDDGTDDEPTYYVACPGCQYADTRPRSKAWLHQKHDACPRCDRGVATAPLSSAGEDLRERALSDEGLTVRTQRITT